MDAEILKLVENDGNEEITEKLKDGFFSGIHQEKNDGFLRAAAEFNISELANMAEKLVSITNQQRHFTLNEQTVDGPVDVAVITFDKGFVWVKRKTFTAIS